MCVTSLSYVDSGTVYFTLLFGPNTFNSEQVIGVMGAYGGYISVMQDADQITFYDESDISQTHHYFI